MPNRDLGHEENPSSSARDRSYRTFRLYLRDRELLRNLGRGRPAIPDRHTALLELVDIVRAMPIPKKEDRQPLRLGLPDDLREVINRRAEETGQTFQDILLMAARNYRDQYPLSEADGD
jgi:hypothetical protein